MISFSEISSQIKPKCNNKVYDQRGTHSNERSIDKV
jgi:hypothetical protein